MEYKPEDTKGDAMTRRASLIRAALGIVAFLGVMFAWFAVRTDERCSRSETRNHEAHKRFQQDFVRRGK
jgi:hypothetical protein